MRDSSRTSTARQRALAILSLVAVVLLAAALLGFLVRNGVYVIVGAVGFALAVAGGWWAITKRAPRRGYGVIGMVVGAALLVTALLLAGNEDWESFVRALISLALLAIAVLAARAAFATSLRTTAAGRVHRVRPPAHPVLLCNPWSGGGKVEKFGLVELASSLGVETVMLDHGLDLAELARDALSRGADCLGMAGGDGSQALVASIAVEHDLPFVCVAAGTRNHFALDLGLDRRDPRQSVYAFRDAIERRVDYATVNDRFFVNNVSLGVYATVVQQEGYREAKVATTKQLLPELLGETQQPFDLQFVTPEGTEVDGSFLVMVSNNPYVLAASPSTSQRLRLDTGRLGVFAVTAATGAQAAEVVTLALAGQGPRSGRAFEFNCETFEIRSRSGMAYAGVDGEALELETPMTFRAHPRGLRMLVPEGNMEMALRRQSRGVHVHDLVLLAKGASPG
ncbi:MAG TPA: diacylglycerol kinase family protein [Acidimicrobiales bacterium]|nr:diacylglycerol kinase family protein [Acidimicrobiales bacterium]